ncbi:MAG: bifunctional diaminohydroxyphosphoribosylaminopyrimidine deaminase/5-amino-6-(5-phosphoribosylamino)uracil reductase RibD [Phycisphaerales bacterium]|jgi:diaminohydroxyphosphoribosylaminopyrimidine deaminase/5-amino-6-(5-phosphoribosylamino)uracil reductase
MATQDEKYMERALRLARRGLGSVEPNPAVGAVIVKANQVIGKGWHKRFGGPHAEINALENCKNLGVNPNGAAMYVTLEPCSHHGKTGPCTEAIIAAGLSKIFIATIDPSEHARNKGIEQLRNAGIEVQIGICETEARLLNAPFIKYASTGKRWITLKWAQSIDGKLAWSQQNDEQRWISSEKSRKDTHKLRRQAQAILVGINTVLADNPLLTPRPSKGKKITRVVLDSHLRIPLDCKLIKTVRKNPVLVYTTENAIQANSKTAEKIAKKGAELLACRETEGRSNLHFLLDELSKRGIAHLLVEGGPKTFTSFIKEDLADEIVVYIAPKIFGTQGSIDITGPMAELAKAIDLHYVDIERFGNDVRISGLTKKALSEISIPPCK